MKISRVWKRVKTVTAFLVLSVAILAGNAAVPAPVEASTFMGQGTYWYTGDARLYCVNPPVLQVDGSRYCAGGYILVHYPGSPDYCYRRNTTFVRKFPPPSSALSWAYSGPLFYVC